MVSRERRTVLASRRRPVSAAAGVVLLGGALSGCGLIGLPQNKAAELSEWFPVSSLAFRDGQDLPTRYGCSSYPGGQSKTPPLHWTGKPTGTRSYAIVVDDPDADNGAYVHWVIAGIGENTQDLVEGTKIDKTWVQGRNTGKKVGYEPPCPPRGEEHRYRFTIYALNDQAPFKPGATLKDSLGAIAKHTVGRGRITGNFGTE
ncbi:YbhB/YbcL family Raf kinase inhibitor-like protein [Spirillospora sp. NPDC048911]|uniref:YbhB/YbcL family Raf kinase inhibitor-like protein n=1 Tax=Spirillospora sp. NPDC048911 TaxID=3364527 RepID=UPI003712C125